MPNSNLLAKIILIVVFPNASNQLSPIQHALHSIYAFPNAMGYTLDIMA